MIKQKDGSLQLVVSIKDINKKLEYKFTRGNWNSVERDHEGKDISNRTFSCQNRFEVIQHVIGSWADLVKNAPARSTIRGNVRKIEDFYIPQFKRKRNLWIYLPPDYETSKKTYPVLYMNDGQNLFDAATSAFGTEWEIDDSLEKLFIEKKTDGVIVVGIENGSSHRLTEYTPWEFVHDGQTYVGEGNQYVEFLVDTLKPYIDKNYRTKPER